jgi:hypothetical protein
VIPWSRTEASEVDGDESAERELFARRAHVVQGAHVPSLAEVLRKAGARETPMPRARIAVGAALAAACFAAVVTGHRSASPWVEGARTATAEVDAGAGAVGGDQAMASWDWGGEDETCQMDGVGACSREETLACFTPLVALTPPPAAHVRVACESDEVCSFGEP